MTTTASAILRAKEKALRGERLDRDLMLSLLAVREDSPDFPRLGMAAREVSAAITGNKAYLWGAVGIDYSPCEMSCDFCSLGKKWGIVSDGNAHVMDTAEIVGRVRDYAESGVRWIVLRTNQHYRPDRLVGLVGSVRAQVPGNYELGLNTGEFDDSFAAALHAAGAGFVYHSLRLGEGVRTAFNPADRLSTLAAVQRSGLALVHLIEPIGIEHANEELVDLYEVALKHGASVSGGMARIPVAGTPLGIHPRVSEASMARIIAFTRLASAGIVEDICVHPAGQQAIDFGANVAVIDSGAVPRDAKFSHGKWNDVACADMAAMFKKGGYAVHPAKNAPPYDYDANTKKLSNPPDRGG